MADLQSPMYTITLLALCGRQTVYAGKMFTMDSQAKFTSLVSLNTGIAEICQNLCNFSADKRDNRGTGPFCIWGECSIPHTGGISYYMNMLKAVQPRRAIDVINVMQPVQQTWLC